MEAARQFRRSGSRDRSDVLRRRPGLTDYLLDTNALLLLTLQSGKTRRAAREAFAIGGRFVSFVSAIEIAIKHSIGKLLLPSPFDIDFSNALQEFARDLGAEVVPLELSHVGAMSRLPLRHRDP